MSEPTKPRPLKRTLPPDLQSHLNVIETKVFKNTSLPDNLDDRKKRWLVVGICVQTIITPLLRTYVEPVVTKLCYSLTSRNRIHEQSYGSFLKIYSPTNTALNYEAINNNKTLYGWNRARYDYRVKSPVDLSRLFLQTHMAHFTAFDDSCDSSAVLGIIINIDRFPPVVQADARKIRADIRSPWAHCDFTEWTATKYRDSFQLMGQLIINLNLNDTTKQTILGKLHTWEVNGEHFLNGTIPGAGLGEIHQQTLHLIENADILMRKSEKLIRVPQELEEMENGLQKLLDKIRDLKNVC